MKLELQAKERASLTLAAVTSASPDVRKRVLWVLALADGAKVARLARAVNVSRPTVYRVASVWRETKDPNALHPMTAARVAERIKARRGETDPPAPSESAGTGTREVRR
jgi:transposase-like protein